MREPLSRGSLELGEHTGDARSAEVRVCRQSHRGAANATTVAAFHAIIATTATATAIATTTTTTSAQPELGPSVRDTLQHEFQVRNVRRVPKGHQCKNQQRCIQPVFATVREKLSRQRQRLGRALGDGFVRVGGSCKGRTRC